MKNKKTYTKKYIIKELLTMFSGKTFSNNKDVNDFFTNAIDVAYTEGYKTGNSITINKTDKAWAILKSNGEFKTTGYFEDCASCGNTSDGYCIHLFKKDAEYYASNIDGDIVIPVLIKKI